MRTTYIMVGCTVLLLALALGLMVYEAAPTKERKIAVVLYGQALEDRWRDLDQGIRQACQDIGIEKPIALLAPAGDASGQKALIERELAGQAEGLLIAPGGDLSLEDLPNKVPVVLAEEAAASYDCVRAEDEAMALALAEYLQGTEGLIAIAPDALGRAFARERQQAFQAALGQDCLVLEYPSEIGRTAAIASALANNRDIAVLVALDSETLDIAIDAVPASMTETRLCGVGNSAKAVHATDQGLVEALVYANEYAMGYIATMRLAESMGLAKRADYPAIPFNLVRKDDLYTPENERLLFPLLP